MASQIHSAVNHVNVSNGLDVFSLYVEMTVACIL